MKHFPLMATVVFLFLIVKPCFGEMEDPPEIFSKYGRLSDARLAQLKGGTRLDEAEKIQTFLKQSNLPEEDVYLAKRQLAITFQSMGKYTDADTLCHSIVARDDDYGLKSSCIQVSGKPLTEQRFELEALFEQSLATEKDTNLPTQMQVTFSIYSGCRMTS